MSLRSQAPQQPGRGALCLLGADEVAGILKLLRADRQHALALLEQARFVDDLDTERGLSPVDIAQQLARSLAWVTVRLGLLRELSPLVRDALLAGAFPVYAYLCTLRPFRRLKSVSPSLLRERCLEQPGKVAGDGFQIRSERTHFPRPDQADLTLRRRHERVSVAAFVTYTDSETWASEVHPTQALQWYRNRAASQAMTGTPCSRVMYPEKSVTQKYQPPGFALDRTRWRAVDE